MIDEWTSEDDYWRSNYRRRPYAGSVDYDTLQGGYRYGYEAAHNYRGRAWNDIESDLERDWGSYQYGGRSTWQQVKDAARDAWDRVTGKHTQPV